MKTIKTTLYIQKDKWVGDTVISTIMHDGYTQLGTYDVDVPIPEVSDDELKEAKIAALYEQLAEIDTDAQQKIESIKEKIAELRK